MPRTFRSGAFAVELPSNPAELVAEIIEDAVVSRFLPVRPESSLWLQPVTALPAAGVKTRGQLVLLAAAGADDALYLCRRKADGSYAWVLVA